MPNSNRSGTTPNSALQFLIYLAPAWKPHPLPPEPSSSIWFGIRKFRNESTRRLMPWLGRTESLRWPINQKCPTFLRVFKNCSEFRLLSRWICSEWRVKKLKSMVIQFQKAPSCSPNFLVFISTKPSSQVWMSQTVIRLAPHGVRCYKNAKSKHWSQSLRSWSFWIQLIWEFHSTDVSDPHTYNPDRWMKDGSFVKDDRIIPFSLGKRACLGESLARMELFLFTATFLQHFEFLPEVDGQIPPLEYEPGLLKTPVPFKVRTRERK